MDELGFRPEASDEVKKAFVKNLIKQAQATEFARQQERNSSKESQAKETKANEQISLFDQKIPS